MKLYNQIKLACLATMLAIGTTYAAPACDSFQIKIDNKLPDNLLVTKVKLSGAAIQPSGFTKIDANSEAVLTVNNPEKDIMNGKIVLRTATLPSKKIKITFTLENKAMVCEHTDKTGSEAAGYPLSNTRTIGGVTYTING